VTFQREPYQGRISGCPALDITSRFLLIYNKTGVQDPAIQVQVNWNNEWEPYNASTTGPGNFTLDPDGAIRHQESREQAEEGRDNLRNADHFTFCLNFIPGIRSTGISKKSTAFSLEATVKVNAAINHLTVNHWYYYGRVRGHTDLNAEGIFHPAKPVDVWVQLLQPLNLECESDLTANYKASLQDLTTLPAERPTSRRIAHKITGKDTIWLGSQETAESFRAGAYSAKRRAKDRANRAFKREKHTTFKLERPDVARADITDQPRHRSNLAKQPSFRKDIKPEVAKVTQFSPVTKEQSGQVPRQLPGQKVAYQEIFGDIVNNPKEFLFPAEVPPFTGTGIKEEKQLYAYLTKTTSRKASRLKPSDRGSSFLNPLKLEYESDPSVSASDLEYSDSELLGDDSPGGIFNEADAHLLPEPLEPFSPHSPIYSPRTPSELSRSPSPDSPLYTPENRKINPNTE